METFIESVAASNNRRHVKLPFGWIECRRMTHQLRQIDLKRRADEFFIWLLKRAVTALSETRVDVTVGEILIEIFRNVFWRCANGDWLTPEIIRSFRIWPCLRNPSNAQKPFSNDRMLVPFRVDLFIFSAYAKSDRQNVTKLSSRKVSTRLIDSSQPSHVVGCCRRHEML